MNCARGGGDASPWVGVDGWDNDTVEQIGVDLDYEFQLGLEDLEQRLGDLPTVDHVVEFVRQRLQERAVA